MIIMSSIDMKRESVSTMVSVREREELAFALLTSLPRSNLAAVHRRIAPLLHFDVVGLLPDEVALEVLSYLPFKTLLACSLVSRRWRALADDQSLWRNLCLAQNWKWRTSPSDHELEGIRHCTTPDIFEDEDEGMGDEEDSEETVQNMLVDDSGFLSMVADTSLTSHSNNSPPLPSRSGRLYGQESFQQSPRNTSPPLRFLSYSKPDYKVLHQTHVKLRHRLMSGSYSLSNLQASDVDNGHTNIIYCLQLYTYPETGVQVLFTGSKDCSVREWNLATGKVTRVIDGIHRGSVLSICVHHGLLVSAGGDRQVVVWDLKNNMLVKAIRDHEDSVLCVRLDNQRLVSCSKDRTVRTYSLPDFTLQHTLSNHRVAVNAVAISPTHIISASGDRSMRVWDAETGQLLRAFENHHCRAIASIDFMPPFVISGASDRHLRLLDITTLRGWSTARSTIRPSTQAGVAPNGVCETCGNEINVPTVGNSSRTRPRAHEDTVRSVVLGPEFVLSGSYDHTIKVWDRETGAHIVDLTGGHTGRIFCVGSDAAKIVSCGEDQKICIWDFSHGIDTSFVQL